jgi:hypothetical protein
VIALPTFACRTIICMTISERIVASLAHQAICDDCLTTLAQLKVRQHANQACRNLEKCGQVIRLREMCPQCNRTKIINTLIVGAGSSSRRADSPPQPLKVAPLANGSSTFAGPVSDAGSPEHAWHWEGFIQSRIVGYLANGGHEIVRVADTGSREPGIDVIAKTPTGIPLHITVKGFSTAASKNTQGRHYFADALLDLVIYRQESPSCELGIGLPAGIATYENLACRIGWLKTNLPFTIYWVSQDGTVKTS